MREPCSHSIGSSLCLTLPCSKTRAHHRITVSGIARMVTERQWQITGLATPVVRGPAVAEPGTYTSTLNKGTKNTLSGIFSFL